jgi:flagellar biogenesis protein FliO
MSKPTRPSANSRWGVFLALGVVAVVGGVVVPQVVNGDLTASPTAKTSKPSVGEFEYAPPSWPDAPSHGAMFARLAVGTAVVLALCVVLLRLGRGWLVSPPTVAAEPGALRLKATLPLGNRCVVHVVEIAHRQILVGADAAGIKTMVPLHAFDDLVAESPTEAT